MLISAFRFKQKNVTVQTLTLIKDMYCTAKVQITEQHANVQTTVLPEGEHQFPQWHRHILDRQAKGRQQSRYPSTTRINIILFLSFSLPLSLLNLFFFLFRDYRLWFFLGIYPKLLVLPVRTFPAENVPFFVCFCLLLGFLFFVVFFFCFVWGFLVVANFHLLAQDQKRIRAREKCADWSSQFLSQTDRSPPQRFKYWESPPPPPPNMFQTWNIITLPAKQFVQTKALANCGMLASRKISHCSPHLWHPSHPLWYSRLDTSD